MRSVSQAIQATSPSKPSQKEHLQETNPEHIEEVKAKIVEKQGNDSRNPSKLMVKQGLIEILQEHEEGNEQYQYKAQKLNQYKANGVKMVVEFAETAGISTRKATERMEASTIWTERQQIEDINVNNEDVIDHYVNDMEQALVAAQWTLKTTSKANDLRKRKRDKPGRVRTRDIWMTHDQYLEEEHKEQHHPSRTAKRSRKSKKSKRSKKSKKSKLSKNSRKSKRSRKHKKSRSRKSRKSLHDDADDVNVDMDVDMECNEEDMECNEEDVLRSEEGQHGVVGALMDGGLLTDEESDGAVFEEEVETVHVAEDVEVETVPDGEQEDNGKEEASDDEASHEEGALDVSMMKRMHRFPEISTFIRDVVMVEEVMEYIEHHDVLHSVKNEFGVLRSEEVGAVKALFTELKTELSSKNFSFQSSKETINNNIYTQIHQHFNGRSRGEQEEHKPSHRGRGGGVIGIIQRHKM